MNALLNSTDIAQEIESVLLTKNPVSLFFGLSNLRTLFEDLADSLLSNIEKIPMLRFSYSSSITPGNLNLVNC